MIPAPFEYVRPGSFDEAFAALGDPEAKVLAGGHSLLPAMKLRLARPTLLVDIGSLDLRGTAGGTVGALATYSAVAAAAGIPDALRECASAVGDLQVRNAGTVGGGIAHGDPSSDIAAAVLALGATLRFRSAKATRECAAEDFFLGAYMTALEPQELLCEIALPRVGTDEGSAYEAVEDPASGYPSAGAAARVRIENGVITECAIALTGVASRPERLAVVEGVVAGHDEVPALAVLREALADVEVTVGEGGVEYRRQLAAVVVRRAVEKARIRAVAAR